MLSEGQMYGKLMLLNRIRNRDTLTDSLEIMPHQQTGGSAGNYPLSAYEGTSEIRVVLYIFSQWYI